MNILMMALIENLKIKFGALEIFQQAQILITG